MHGGFGRFGEFGRIGIEAEKNTGAVAAKVPDSIPDNSFRFGWKSIVSQFESAGGPSLSFDAPTRYIVPDDRYFFLFRVHECCRHGQHYEKKARRISNSVPEAVHGVKKCKLFSLRKRCRSVRQLVILEHRMPRRNGCAAICLRDALQANQELLCEM